MTTDTLHPAETVQKILLSTTTRLLGSYESEGALLTHAWPDLFGSPRANRVREEEGPASRNALMFAFRTEPMVKAPGVPVPNYAPVGEVICSYLAVLFGKRFDNHGLIEGSGFFHLPDLTSFGQLSNHMLAHNSHAPRIDFSVPLNLTELSRIERLILNDSLAPRFVAAFRGSAKFYLRALQNAESDPEVAYLHLITAGEILSNFGEREKDTLLDEQTRTALQDIANGLPDGPRLARFLSGKLLQVKRRFVSTIVELVDPAFFGRSQSRDAPGALKAETFGDAISSAYDLRSRYVHTGVPFGHWVSTWIHEVQVGKPVVRDKDLGKVLARAPTFSGLERVIRYCLLRFACVHGAYVAPASGPS